MVNDHTGSVASRSKHSDHVEKIGSLLTDAWTYTWKFVNKGPFHLTAAISTAFLVVGIVNIDFLPRAFWWSVALVGFMVCGFLVWREAEHNIRRLTAEVGRQPVSQQHRDQLRSIIFSLAVSMGEFGKTRATFNHQGLSAYQTSRAFTSHFPSVAEQINRYNKMVDAGPGDKTQRLANEITSALENLRAQEKVYGVCFICDPSASALFTRRLVVPRGRTTTCCYLYDGLHPLLQLGAFTVGADSAIRPPPEYIMDARPPIL